MKNIIAIGGSNSSQSINRQLASWAANLVNDSQVNTLDLNDFEMPIYSSDRENKQVFHKKHIHLKISSKKRMVLSFH